MGARVFSESTLRSLIASAADKAMEAELSAVNDEWVRQLARRPLFKVIFP